MNVHIAWFSLIVPALTFVWYLARRTDPHHETSLKASIETAEKKTEEGFKRVENTLTTIGTKLENVSIKVIEHGVKIDMMQQARRDAREVAA